MSETSTFRAVVTKRTYNCPDPPNHQMGWAVLVKEYLAGEGRSPYKVGDEVGFANGCFAFEPQEGDEVLVNYNSHGKWDKPSPYNIAPLFTIVKI
jgi:hypothetical protein